MTVANSTSTPTPTQEKSNKSWFFNWLSHWTASHKSDSSSNSSSSKSNNHRHKNDDDNDSINSNEYKQRRKQSDATNEIMILEPNDQLSIYRVEENHSSTAFDKNSDPLGSTTTIQQQRHISFPQHQPPHRYYNISLTTTSPPTPTSERRNSQQTTASSVLSDDQFSCSSGHRRNSNDRSILRELWSKARKHHPHYPKFHWPHRRHHHHHHHHHHRHRHHKHRIYDNDNVTNSIGSTSPGRHSYDGGTTGERHSIINIKSSSSGGGGSSGIPINATTANSATAYEVQNMASSYQDQHLLFSPQPSPRQRKRHSITSLVSGDRISLSSRPASLFRSQPGSPVFAALLKDGQLYDEEEDDDVDPYWLDGPILEQQEEKQQERWVVKTELVQISLDDGLFCSPFDISPSAGVHEKHVLHVGCGDGTWATEVALEYPRWRVVGIDDRSGGASPNRRMLPRNFKFIRCYESSLLEGIKNMPDASFDLIHCRFLLLSFTADEYQELVKQCWRVCKPGGYVELLEMDMRIYYDRPPVGKVAQTFNSEVIHVIESKSLDPRLARQLKDIFGNLTRPDHDDDYRMLYHGSYVSLPLGLWGGRIGIRFREDLHELFELFQPAIAKSNQTKPRTDLELESAFETMDAEMDLQRAFMNLHFAYAQKLERA